MRRVHWLAAVLAGVVTFLLRKHAQLVLDGALYLVWTPPLPSGVHIVMFTTTQEMWNAVLRWWQQTTWVGWLWFIACGAAAGWLLRARLEAKDGSILGSAWLIPGLAIAALIVADYHPATLWSLIHVPGVRLWALLLLIGLVFAVNLVWAALLERLILFLDRKIPEWLG
jgi:hypothetical protein